jgi:hypothetical protein
MSITKVVNLHVNTFSPVRVESDIVYFNIKTAKGFDVIGEKKKKAERGYRSVSFNKEYIRPVYRSIPFWGIITGSFSNFMAAFIMSMFSVAPILANRLSIRKARLIFYTIAILVFIVLTFEEINPFVDASETYDPFDIIASGLGSVIAVLSFEIFFRKKLEK